MAKNQLHSEQLVALCHTAATTHFDPPHPPPPLTHARPSPLPVELKRHVLVFAGIHVRQVLKRTQRAAGNDAAASGIELRDGLRHARSRVSEATQTLETLFLFSLQVFLFSFCNVFS